MQNLYSKKFLGEVEEKDNTEDDEGNNNTRKTHYTKTNYIERLLWLDMKEQVDEIYPEM